MQFPDGKNIKGNHPFSTALLEKSLAAIFNAKREVNGFLRISCGANTLYFLFFLKNSIHAAGKFCDHRPASLTVKEFFTEVVSRNPEDMTVSLHEAEPQLVKSFLVFIQDEPTLKVPAGMIDLDAVAGQIAHDTADALVVLESDGFFNFFYFHNGAPSQSYFSEPCAELDGLPIDEQMLLYAYRPGKNVAAYTYRNIVTTAAPDADDGSHAAILTTLNDILYPVEMLATESIYTLSSDNVPAAGRMVRVCFSEGVDKDTSRSVSVPFTIGRKEGELIIADPLISKRHAVVREISGSLVIEDLGSTNGTFVNGVEVKLQQLASGDLVKVGNSIFQVQPD